jgi:hypothetical protein
MASASRPSQKFSSLSIVEAINKIQAAVEEINLRGGVKDHERKRVREAFAMLAQSPGPSSGKTGKRRGSYLRFLQQVDKDCGSQLVVASSVGIGLSGIASMKELTRLRLPLEIKKHERALKSPALQAVADEYRTAGLENCFPHKFVQHLTRPPVPSNASTVDVPSTQSHRPVPAPEQSYSEQLERPSIPLDMFGSQTSRVFELTLEDAQAIITSQQVLGRVLLMEPHSKQTLPFITVTLTEELCGYFTVKRNRVG